MSSEVRKLVAVIVGGMALVAGALALITLLNEGMSLAGCTAATPLGWTVPLVSILVIAAAAWYLLAQTEKDPGSAKEFRSAVCPSCGRNVLEDWRMCPYCGSGMPGTGPEADTTD